MIRRSTLVLLTCMATMGTSTGTTLSTTLSITKSASATELPLNSQTLNSQTLNSQTVNLQTPLIIAQASGGENAGAIGGGLDLNSRGEAVKALQLRLQAGDYYQGPIDGIYGFATERAVRAFQADAGLSETGSLNDETWQKLQLATGNLVGESLINANATSADRTDATEQAPETAPTASELPAEGEETTEVAIPPGEGGLGRVFGLSLGLVAVLASFGIGFFLANKDKANTDEEGEWNEIEPSTDQPSGALTNGLSPTQTALPLHKASVASNAAYSASGNTSTSPLIPSTNGNGPMNGQISSQTSGQMGGTSPLTPVDIIDGLIGDLRNPDPARRRKAIWELGQRGNSVAMKPLVDAMVDADSKEKSLVLAALSEIGIRSLKPMSKALAIALQDDNPEVRKNAIRDLTRVYDLVVQISQMLGHATEDEDPEVRQTASWALEQLSRIRRSQDIDANVRSFTGSSNPTPPIDLLSSEASLRRSSQQGV